jgi:hypothetical protein
MVIAVIITVIILALVVSGYWINSDFKLERQGMLQISSLPTGAEITIDGEDTWSQHTNTSKVLSSGEHSITLKKDGYDTWSRTFSITEGLLYRIHYPRLFLKERKKSSVLDVSSATFATVSPNREKMLIANSTTEWDIVDLTHDELEKKPISITGIFSATSMAPGAEKGLFVGEIVSANWSTNNERILISAKTDNDIEWIVFDIKNPSNSVNITKMFNASFSNVAIIDASANSLYAIVNGNLHKIDVNSRQISAIMIHNVVDYDFYESEIIFAAKNEEEKDGKYYVGLYKNVDDIKTLFTLDSQPKTAILRFYDDMYIAAIVDGKIPVKTKDDQKEYFAGEITSVPNTFKVGHAGEFITATSGPQIITVDMEAKTVTEWQMDSDRYAWLDSDMFYVVKDGELIVRDYDGQNRRVLANNVSNHFPVTITSDKWLYYFSDDELIREIIRD